MNELKYLERDTSHTDKPLADNKPPQLIIAPVYEFSIMRCMVYHPSLMMVNISWSSQPYRHLSSHPCADKDIAKVDSQLQLRHAFLVPRNSSKGAWAAFLQDHGRRTHVKYAVPLD